MRYFFDIADARGTIKDAHGIAFQNLEAAKAEAKRTLTEIAANEPYPEDDDLTLSIRVRDEAGQGVYDLCLQLQGKQRMNPGP